MSLARLLDRVETAVPGVPRALAELVVFNVVRELCHDACVWNARVAQDMVADQRTYPIPLLPGAALTLLMKVIVDGREYRPVNEMDRPRYTVDGSYTVDHDANAIQIAKTHVPDKDHAIVMDVAYRPVTLADTPDQIFETYDECLYHGALGELFMQPSKPWMNLLLSTQHRVRYKGQKGRARRQTMSSRTRAEPGWRFPHATVSRNLRF